LIKGGEDRSIHSLDSILILEQDAALCWNQNNAAYVNVLLPNTATELCAEKALSRQPYFICLPSLTYSQNYNHVSQARHADSNLS